MRSASLDGHIQEDRSNVCAASSAVNADRRQGPMSLQRQCLPHGFDKPNTLCSHAYAVEAVAEYHSK